MAGLQTFNAAGEKTFDAEYVTTLALGTGSTGAAAGSITDARINGRRVWVCVIKTSKADLDGYYGCCRLPVFTQNGNSISWTFSPAPENFEQLLVYPDIYSVDFIYGVY